jgi:hypothetical protein
VLDRIRRDAEIAVHGVSLSIGGTDALSESHLRGLAELVRRVEPVVVSDHLCFGTAHGHYAHDLWPLPYTEEAAAHVAERVRRVQDFLGRRILLENVSSYVAYRASTMTEPEFLASVSVAADCEILLDVNNVVVSAHNHGFAAEAYVDAIPFERVRQLHLAGHEKKGSLFIDDHGSAVPDEVWALYRRVVARAGHVPVIVEWDSNLPELDAVLAQAVRAAEIEKEVLDGERPGRARTALLEHGARPAEPG